MGICLLAMHEDRAATLRRDPQDRQRAPAARRCATATPDRPTALFTARDGKRILGPTQPEVGVARDEKLELLRRIPLFSGFDRKRIERLGMLAEEVDVPAGKVLMRQGEIGSDMMVIVRGSVAVERDGSRLNTLGPGDFFGEIALVDGGPRTATVTVEEPSTLLVLAHRDFHAMMDEFPEIAGQVMNALANRVRHLEPDAPH
jgi:CRP/FNR family transcriptional regulator, cyclic AMP receptor protein